MDAVEASPASKLGYVPSVISFPLLLSTPFASNALVSPLGGIPSAEGMIQEPMPSFLDKLSDRLEQDHFLPKRPNHALINEYKGDEGIHAHKDGPVYFPRVIILSIGGSTCMTFRDRLRDPSLFQSLIIKPRSLLIFTKDAYDKVFHEIPMQLQDKVETHCVNASAQEIGMNFLRTTRISITMRVVPNLKIAEKMETPKKPEEKES